MHPLARGCYKGELNVCKWLYDNGASEDITKANFISDCTPMYIACLGGHLSVCQWLFEVGAAGDITKTNNSGSTPMHGACEGDHLSVCQWLFEVGAAGDITKTDNDGSTPMHKACRGGNLSVCQWLVLNSALNDPTLEQVDEAIVQGAARCMFDHTQSKLLSWAHTMIYTHDTFLNVFLRASVILPASQQHAHPSARCLLPLLPRTVLERVSWFAGVEVGRRVRNVREFKESLEALDQEKFDLERFLTKFS